MTSAASTGGNGAGNLDSPPLCDFCNEPAPLNRTSCPHCGRPSLFPNVRMANQPSQKEKLENRYVAALDDARQRACEPELTAFSDACKATRAVLNCTLAQLYRRVASGTEVFETFYDLERLLVRSDTPSQPDWQTLRPQAEIELLGCDEHKDRLFYALLSIEEEGLTTYGECTVVLKEAMIAHRSSCFEENTGVFWMQNKTFPPGKRSDWENRHKLCVAKLAGQIDKKMQPAHFQSVLLSKGRTSLDDNFIEVQVFGPITSRSLRCVAIRGKSLKGKRVYWEAVKHKLESVGVTVAKK